MSTPRTPGGGIDPSVWGESGWTFLRSVLHGFDPAEQSKAKLEQWWNLLPEVLPCANCRVNFGDKTLTKYPIRPYLERNMLPEYYRRVRAEVRKHETKTGGTLYAKLHREAAAPSRYTWRFVVGTAVVAIGVGVALGYALKTYREARPAKTV